MFSILLWISLLVLLIVLVVSGTLSSIFYLLLKNPMIEWEMVMERVKKMDS